MGSRHLRRLMPGHAPVCCLIGLLAIALSAVPVADVAFGQTSSEQDGPPKAATPYSPLSVYLGNDPVTGEPLPAGRLPQATTTTRSDATSNSARTPSFEDAAIDELLTSRQTMEELTAALNDGDLSKISGLLPATQSASLLSRLEPFLLALHVPFLAWPLGIAIGEVFGLWYRRQDPEYDDFDRTFYGKRAAARLVYAAAIVSMIGLSAWSVHRGFDLSSGELIGLGAASFVALLISMFASGHVRRLDREYLIRSLRYVRQHQQELRRDLSELQRQIGRVGQQGGKLA